MSLRTFVPLAVLLFACQSASAPPPRTGFLSSYVHLEQVSETTMRYLGTDPGLGDYSSFMIEPVKMHFHEDAEGRHVDKAQLRELCDYAGGMIMKSLEGAYTVVREPGPGVARVRLAITDINPSHPVMNVVGAGVGGAAMEAEILDSETGQQIAAVIESQSGTALSLENFSRYGDARGVINEWAARFRKRLDDTRK